MTETSQRKGASEAGPPPPARTPDQDEAERSLGRMVSLGLPAASLVGAIVVGGIAGVGSALLILAAGALIGTIALVWASVRTLSGDAPLSLELEAVAAGRHATGSLAEEKRRLLRALKDLEGERAVGKIDEADYEAFVARYREEAKRVMRAMDTQVAPRRAEAERLAAAHLKKIGLASAAAETEQVREEAPAPAVAPARPGRRGCASCGASNEADAVFCKKCGGPVGAKEAGDATS